MQGQVPLRSHLRAARQAACKPQYFPAARCRFKVQSRALNNLAASHNGRKVKRNLTLERVRRQRRKTGEKALPCRANGHRLLRALPQHPVQIQLPRTGLDEEPARIRQIKISLTRQRHMPLVRAIAKFKGRHGDCSRASLHVTLHPPLLHGGIIGGNGGEREPAVKLRRTGLVAQKRINAQLGRRQRRGQICLDADAAAGLALTRGKAQGHGLAIAGKAAIHLERAVKRAGAHHHIHILDLARAAVTGIRQGHTAVVHLDLVKGDVLRVHPGKARLAALHQPVKAAILIERKVHLRPVQPHFHDADFALQQGRQFDAHLKTGDGQQRVFRIPHPHIGEGERRSGQKAHVGLAQHRHLVAQRLAGIALEGRTVRCPVDKERPDQRRQQRQDDSHTRRDIDRIQRHSPVLGRLLRAAPAVTRARSCPDS